MINTSVVLRGINCNCKGPNVVHPFEGRPYAQLDHENFVYERLVGSMRTYRKAKKLQELRIEPVLVMGHANIA